MQIVSGQGQYQPFQTNLCQQCLRQSILQRDFTDTEIIGFLGENIGVVPEILILLIGVIA